MAEQESKSKSKHLSHVEIHGGEENGRKVLVVTEHRDDDKEPVSYSYDPSNADDAEALRAHVDGFRHGQGLSDEDEPETPLAEAPYREYKERRKRGES